VGGAELERLRRLGGGRAVLPEDGRAAFRGDDRVVAVLEDQDAVGQVNGKPLQWQVVSVEKSLTEPVYRLEVIQKDA
jgi:hypothetical protein